jgi:hypothetical protein
MALYAASLMDIAKPVETKKKGKKVKEEIEPTAEASAPVKEVSEKRMAALAKAQETRKRKREEAAALKKAEEEAIANKEAEIQAKQEEILRKKEELKEKRRLKREGKKQEATPPVSESSSITETTEEPKLKKVRKPKIPRDDSIPPTWFQKYVEGVKHEEAKQSQLKVSKKQVEEEARQTATQQWQDGFTRDRVQNEVDGHMTRMYGMIFHNRKMK